jgi:hypothetical protein
VALAYNEEKVYDFVAKIRAVLKSEDIDLGKELNKQLRYGRAVATERRKNPKRQRRAVLC